MEQPSSCHAPDMALASRLFERLHQDSFDGVGITRDTYGAGEQRAHDLMATTARELGLEVRTDAALNLYLTLPGHDRQVPAAMTGSHLDSVPRGGNYDGAAGVVAGLAMLAGWVAAGVVPSRDVTVMAVRAEESAWFPVSYIGSKAAFGLLEVQALAARRFDTRESLATHIAQLGGQPERIGSGTPHLEARAIDCFIELHIEQGPVLIDAGYPLGVVNGICGSLRYRHAQAIGRYAHSGATPRTHRQDAVVAVAALIHRLHQDWIALETEGHELTLTIGQVNTDARQADFSKVAGLVSFCIDIRSRSTDTLQRMDQRVQQAADALAKAHGVRFDLGARSDSQAAAMDGTLQTSLVDATAALGLRAHRLPSGAGHDAAVFANAGVPTAMLFVRNAQGSHNPDEAMAMDDFSAATRVLGRVLGNRAGLSFPLERKA